MSPSTVSKNGVVGQATSFDLTLDGKTPYTYTQTFGNICSVDINDNIATVTIIPTEIGLLTGSITFNEEATCNITIDVQAFIWSVSPDKVTQTKGNQRCYTNIKKNGVNIDFNNIPTSRLTCDYVKNIATGEIIARGSDYQAKSVTSGDVAMLVRQGGSSGNICFTGYTDEIPDGEYIIKFTYTPPTSVDPESTPQELYVTFVMQTTQPEPEITVTPSTVSENGVVGQATSFNLTLSGGSTYTYTQTFGNICSVDINDNIATVTIVPTEVGLLTGSITFSEEFNEESNEEATCNITITVSKPTPPTGGFNPTTMNVSLARSQSETCYFELLSGSYDSSTENVKFSYTITNTSSEGDIRGALNISEDINTPPEYQLILESNNEPEETLTGIVNVYAKIFDDDMVELLRTYTATINVTILA